MRITFVRPNMYNGRSDDAMEPLVFGILAGLTPEDVECRLIDERLEEVPHHIEADLVAITAETYTARRAYQIASACERDGVPVVLGGYHPTFRPGEALQFASAVVVGDAEGVWPTIVEDARRGALQRSYRGPLPDLSGLRVDRSIFQRKRYQPISLVQFGRGCRYACDFCSIHAFYGSSLRWRPVGEVVRELEAISHPYVFFTDDNLFNNGGELRRLLAAIRPLEKRWSCQASLDVAADPQLVRLMADSGCLAVMIGFESLDRNNLQQMRKSWNRKYGRYDDLVGVFRDHGIMVYGGFVLGYDHDTEASFDETLAFAVRNRLFLANFNPLTPTPGSALYDRLAAEDRLIHDPWWLHDEFRYGDGMFRPRHMTAEQLHEGCYRMRTEFNRAGSLLYRALDLRANCRSPIHAFAYLVANLTSRREISRKQGQALGDSDRPLEPIYPPTRVERQIASLSPRTATA
jgi:radical SAM superfamily enzyme YgiQ (UPF0313 family)